MISAAILLMLAGLFILDIGGDSYSPSEEVDPVIPNPVGQTGTEGDDVFIGTGSTDFFDGLGGNDTISGFGNDDTLIGGDGDDSIRGHGEDDSLIGGAGNDTLHGGFDDDILDGGTGDDVLFGSRGDDTLNGGAGNDTLDGGEGNDVLSAPSGQNTFITRGGDDVVNGGSDVDLIISGAGDSTLNGNAGNDTINSGLGSDLIMGGAGDDQISGRGFDTAFGGSGNDSIFAYTADGGEGDDLLSGINLQGDAGDDTLIGSVSEANLSGGTGDGIIHLAANVLENSGEFVTTDYDPDSGFGGEGADLLFGNGGETLSGGADDDDFVIQFTEGWQDDPNFVPVTLTDFDPFGEYGETLRFQQISNRFSILEQDPSEVRFTFGPATALSAGELEEGLTVSQADNGQDAILSLRGRDIAILENTDAETLAADTRWIANFRTRGC